jgi:hypothetical protein
MGGYWRCPAQRRSLEKFSGDKFFSFLGEKIDNFWR